METLPVTECVALVRTDFSSSARWDALQQAASSPPEPFFYNLVAIDDNAFQDKTAKEMIASIPEGYPHVVIFIADPCALKKEGFPCLVLDLREEPGRSFRALASQLASIENNLSIANMGFEEFAEAANADGGVFRGF